MTRRAPRIVSWLLLIGSGATLFQTFPITGVGGGGNFGCQRFATNAAGGAIDWCFLLDCENGFFGGLIHPCDDPSLGPWLLDCPNATPGGTDTGTGTGTDTGTGTSDGTTTG